MNTGAQQRKQLGDVLASEQPLGSLTQVGASCSQPLLKASHHQDLMPADSLKCVAAHAWWISANLCIQHVGYECVLMEWYSSMGLTEGEE